MSHQDLEIARSASSIEEIKRSRNKLVRNVRRCHNEFERLTKGSVDSWNPKHLTQLLEEAGEQQAIHKALQQSYDDLVADTPDIEEAEPPDLARELMREISLSIDKFSSSQDGQDLHSHLERLHDTKSFTTTLARERVNEATKKVEQFLVQSRPCRGNDLIDHLRKANQDLLHIILQAQTEEEIIVRRELNSKREERTTDKKDSTNSRSLRPALPLVIPKFSGQHMDWLSFQDTFAALIKRHGSELSEEKKLDYLVQAMTLEESREIVSQFKGSSDCFSEALDILSKTYGRPTSIYPQLIEDLITANLIPDSAEGLRHARVFFRAAIKHAEKINGNSFSTILAALFLRLLDPSLLAYWENKPRDKSTELPTIEEVLDCFWEREMNKQQPAKGTNLSKPSSKPSKSSRDRDVKVPVMKVQTKLTCPVCSAAHPLSRCSVFHKYDVAKRLKVVEAQKHCTNCLSFAHQIGDCQSTFRCRRCNERHHTFLHKDSNPASSNSSASTSTSNSSGTTPANSTTPVFLSTLQVPRPHLEEDEYKPPHTSQLGTALANIVNGPRSLKIRMALDSGAGTALITERTASFLRLKRRPIRVSINGVKGGGRAKHCVTITLNSLHSDQTHQVECVVVPSIPAALPPRDPDAILNDAIVKDKTPLGDPAMGGKLDVLIDAPTFTKCVQGQIELNPETNVWAFPSIFGWLICAPRESTPQTPILDVQPEHDILNEALSKLWEDGQIPHTQPTSSEEQQALTHFNQTHQILPSGCYQVKLPRVQNPPPLGDSRKAALRRFFSNQKTLEKKGTADTFNDCIREYLTLGHAEIVPAAQLQTKSTYYLPVHGVVKESSTTTKLRPVFDASAATTSGVSLNDLLLPGPNLYPLITDIVIPFRMHPVAFSADIGKMFREIELHPTERDYHRFFAKGESGVITECRMRRLTFGVKSSPFLATRVIRHLAEKHSTTQPLAADAILTSFYVDDLLSGADSVEEARALQRQLNDLLFSAGMTLRKWRSNSTEFLSSVPQQLVEKADLHISSPQESSKALGIHWNVSKDALHIATLVFREGQITKRVVASVSAQVYDVLGFFAPTTIIPKLLLQELWKLKLGWDDPVPSKLAKEFLDWTSQLSHISDTPIPRRLTQEDSPAIFTSLHGFADASKVAYGGVVYLRTVHQNTNVSVSLVFAKARVAPLKFRTIPRMELMAAHLLSQLLKYVANLLHIPNEKIFAWTDSAIVLAWLRKSPSALTTFVAHRISATQEAVPSSLWRHVATTSNPADVLSRGASGSSLRNLKLWWEGPPWLKLPPEVWPKSNRKTPSVLPETKEIKVAVNAATISPTNDLWKSFSSFTHLTRVIAWIRRFVYNTQHSTQKILTDVLTSEEVLKSKAFLFRVSQLETYPDTFQLVIKGKKHGQDSPFKNLDLSINSEGVLMVSGRIRQAKNPTQPKRLIPLSLHSDLTRLFLSTSHRNLSHPGISTHLAILADAFHIPNVRNYLKKISRDCRSCQRAYARPLSQRMGLLPAIRSTPSAPFSVCGVDFAGPFRVRQGYTRKPVIIKAYACVFICMVTRAIHLELCADLTTTEFMAAFRRFCGRRGTPTEVHSDNGSNFVGAKGEIEELQRLMDSRDTQNAISHLTTTTGIKWFNIPPRTPHFGGLWESAVRSMKLLLRKLFLPHTLTFQELQTILIEAEAVINSRPLAPTHATDPEDPLVLTAGHFLIGRPLKAMPQKIDERTPRITSERRWQLVKKLTQELWTAWQGRYLQSMQARSKWQNPTRNFQPGDVVLVKDSILAHPGWPLARVTRVFPGDDGLVRAVELYLQGKTYQRSSNRLILITQEDQPSLPPGSMSGSTPQS